MGLSVRLLTRNCLYALHSWQLNAAAVVIDASDSYCAGRAFTSTINGYIASVISTA